MDKNETLQLINSLLEKDDIKLEDTELGKNLTTRLNNTKSSLDAALSKVKFYEELLKGLYDAIKSEQGEDCAYEWISDKLDKDLLRTLHIYPPKMYKIVTVGITMKLAVPNNWDDCFIEDLAVSSDFRDADFEICEDYVDITPERLSNYNFNNDADDFEDYEFDE